MGGGGLSACACVEPSRAEPGGRGAGRGVVGRGLAGGALGDSQAPAQAVRGKPKVGGGRIGALAEEAEGAGPRGAGVGQGPPGRGELRSGRDR